MQRITLRHVTFLRIVIRRTACIPLLKVKNGQNNASLEGTRSPALGGAGFQPALIVPHLPAGYRAIGYFVFFLHLFVFSVRSVHFHFSSEKDILSFLFEYLHVSKFTGILPVSRRDRYLVLYALSVVCQ